MTASAVVVKTISEQITEQLRQEILAGEFLPGSPLRECELAERYQVSRHPIRKVLQQLTLEGLLKSKSNCGVVVAESASEHVPGLLTPMRKLLELYALRLALPRVTATHRAEWDRVLIRMRHAADDQNHQEVLRQDAVFHQMILTAAGLDELCRCGKGFIAACETITHWGIPN